MNTYREYMQYIKQSNKPAAKKKAIGWIVLKVGLIVIGAMIALSILWVVIYRFVPPPVTPLMLIRAGQPPLAGKPNAIRKQWVPINKMPKTLISAIIQAEDYMFYKHFGFDFEAIQDAYKKNQRRKKTVIGGSTISQQTAKNVFCWPDRNYLRKAVEAYFTLLIEIFWGKERILEVYMNVIETGNGVYGVAQAAEEYYHKKVWELNARECAMIAAILPNPRKWSPVNPSISLVFRQNAILSRIGMESALSNMAKQNEQADSQESLAIPHEEELTPNEQPENIETNEIKTQSESTDAVVPRDESVKPKGFMQSATDHIKTN